MSTTLQNFGVPAAPGDAFNRGGILMPKVKNRFRVTMTNFGVSQAPVSFTQQVISVARPSVNFNPQPLHSYNSISYYAGKAEWETVEVTVRDDITNNVATLIGAQVQRQMNFFEQTVYEAAGQYKFTMHVDTLDGGGSSLSPASVLEEWVYEGCFLATVNYQGFDYASADAMTIVMSVRIDNATQQTPAGLMPPVPVPVSNTPFAT